MNRTGIFVATTLLATAFAAAQTSPASGVEGTFLALQSPSQGESLERMRLPAPDYETSSLLREALLRSHEVVKNFPYTATAITESTMTLADGNRMVNKKTSLLARDSEGRTRREETLGEIGLMPVKGTHIVLISDPTERIDYVLYPERKVMQQLKHRENEISVQAKGGWTGKEEKPKYLGTVKEETLGTQVIEGITCTGTRLVQTIPAGMIGNEKEMVLTAESWVSRDLHLLVLRKRRNALSGETVYRLTNINRGEPDASLFQVPTDYKLEVLHPEGWRREK